MIVGYKTGILELKRFRRKRDDRMLEQKDLELIADVMDKTIEKRLEPLKEDISEMKEDISGLKKEMSEVKEDISEMKEDISGLKKEMSVVKEDISDLKEDVKSIHLTLENDVSEKIEIIAEGHLDLSRKLNQATQIDNEKEIMKLRIVTLENDVRTLKEKVDRIA